MADRIAAPTHADLRPRVAYESPTIGGGTAVTYVYENPDGTVGKTTSRDAVPAGAWVTRVRTG